MTQSSRESILQMVREMIGPRDTIDDSSSLYHDLSIAGDDAAELLDKIHARFGTSFKGLDFHAYFPNDLDAFCYHLASLFGIKDRRKRFTFGHLVKVVEAGQWFEA